MGSPKDVSAVICTMNSVLSIEQCLRAARESGIGQIVVVDAHSHDGTRAVADAWADVVVEDPGQGLGYARNMGIARTTGTYVLNLGSDNVVTRAAIETMIHTLESGHFHGVSAQTRIEGTDYVSASMNDWRATRFRPGPAAVIGTPTLFRGDELRNHPFDPTRRYSDDAELCERWSRDLGARFAISSATVEELGKTTWSEIVLRCRIYGVSDYEVFSEGRRSGWSWNRRLRSLVHPARVDLVGPVSRMQPTQAMVRAPFLAAITGMRYVSWVRAAAHGKDK